MIFYVRPSKIFVFEKLELILNQLRGAVGIDAGAASFKNRFMFQTSAYYGIDINLDNARGLREGLARCTLDDTYGIHADLAHLDLLPSNSADVIVSTNTLYALTFENRKSAVYHLMRIIKPKGTLVLELLIDQKFDFFQQILDDYFLNVNVIFYKNPISRAYEALFERKGLLDSESIAGKKPFLIFSWLLSRFEYPFSFFRFGNKHALLVISQKKDDEEINTFDLSHVSLIEKKIYTLIVKDQK